MWRYTKQNLDVKWNTLKGALDDYCTFSWNEYNSLDFKTFILNDKKNLLDSYNGLSFSNTYSKPQFENGSGTLQGITFNTKQIKFKIGTYGCTIDEYAQVLDWLNPYRIGNLIFAYDANYACRCKLAQLTDSQKSVVGYNVNNEPCYYFESELTFDIIGEQVKYGVKPYKWEMEENKNNIFPSIYSLASTNANGQSQLDISFTVDITVSNFELEEGVDSLELVGEIVNSTDNNREQLFQIILNREAIQDCNKLIFSYDSNSGTILWGDEALDFSLLTLLSTYRGYKLVDFFSSNKILLPCIFSKPFKIEDKAGTRYSYEQIKFEFTKNIGTPDDFENISIYMYPKKKMI